MANNINIKETVFKVIKIKKIEDLRKIEGEIFMHAQNLDTLFNKQIIEHDFDGGIWIWISDEAINRKLVYIPAKVVKTKKTRAYLKWAYDYEI